MRPVLALAMSERFEPRPRADSSTDCQPAQKMSYVRITHNENDKYVLVHEQPPGCGHASFGRDQPEDEVQLLSMSSDHFTDELVDCPIQRMVVYKYVRSIRACGCWDPDCGLGSQGEQWTPRRDAFRASSLIINRFLKAASQRARVTHR
ncbi:hypothetical protein J6590_012319 [Homalodisca vitripennis]|nr:hypothetical protein J6590_012319 [Homalodisca vitripennis]